MVTLDGLRLLRESALSADYWFEATAHTIRLAAQRPTSPRPAFRWLRHQAQEVTDQLDRPYAQPGRHWLTNSAEHERALTALAEGQMCTLTLHDDTTRYLLSARSTRYAR